MIRSHWRWLLGFIVIFGLIFRSQGANLVPTFPSCPVGTLPPAQEYICLEYNAVLRLYSELVASGIYQPFDLPRFATPPDDWNYCNTTWNNGLQKIRCSYPRGLPDGTIYGFFNGTLELTSQSLSEELLTKPDPFTWPPMVNLPNFQLPSEIQPPMLDIQNLLVPAIDYFGQSVLRPAFGLRVKKAYFSIPTELGLYPTLDFLELSGDVNNSVIPTQLGLLTSLTKLQISAGSSYLDKPILSIPTEFGMLTKLVTLNIECFGLTTFPTQILNLTTLQSLVLSNCLLTGSFPSEVNLFPNLEELRLDSNSLGGTIGSHAFDNLMNLKTLELSGNDFFGPLPVPASPVLEIYVVPLNSFSGPVPNALTLKPLVYMDIKHNNLNGTLEFLPKLTKLFQFCGQKNAFTGTIPNISGLTELAFLDLAINSLTGTVPPSITTSTTLETLYLQNNLLSGTFPLTSDQSALQSAYLGSNLFDGTLPSSWFETTSMSLLDISRNKFSGPPPARIACTLWNLDCTFNQLSGPMAFSLTTDPRCTPEGFGYGGVQIGALRFEFNRLNISEIALDFSKPFFVFPQDTDECSDGTHTCPENSECVDGWNPILSYTCRCIDGYAPVATDPLPDQHCVQVSRAGVIAGIVCSVVAVIIIALLKLQLIRRWTKFNALPSEVVWGYRNCVNRFGLNWEKRGGARSSYYFKDVTKDPKKSERVLKVFNNHLHGKEASKLGLHIKQITAVYNPLLAESFLNAYDIQKRRLASSKAQFWSENWNTGRGSKPKEAVFEVYKGIVNACPWNKPDQVPIIPALHGTSSAIAEKICETGFANLSSLDDGFYGKGIYFTTHAPYTLSYISNRRDPAMIISWILPGNCFPVTENHTLEDSLLGTALVSGYQSHFVCTTATGEVPPTDRPFRGALFDEIVIPQENQISPAFILHFDPKEMKEPGQKWQKIVAGEPIRTESQRIVTTL